MVSCVFAIFELLWLAWLSILYCFLFPQEVCSEAQEKISDKEKDRHSASDGECSVEQNESEDEPMDSVNIESTATVPIVYICGQFAAPSSAEVPTPIRSNKRADRYPAAGDPVDPEPKAKNVCKRMFVSLYTCTEAII